MKKHISFLLILAVLILPMVAVEARAAETGTCGDGLTWTLDTNGVLTITGLGTMTNYSDSSTAPWYNQRTSIKSIRIGAGVTSIGDYAFYGCSSLTSITIPDSITGIGRYAFEYCSRLTDVYISDIAAWLNLSGSYDATPLRANALAKKLYLNGKLITDLVIPEGVTSIGDFAFEYCGSLTSVTIPEGVTSIGDYAFYGCSYLTSVTIPDSVTGIGRSAFEYCSRLTSVTIPEGVTSIGDFTFEYCSSLTSVTIPEGVTSIGDGAFSGCSSLTSVVIPESVTSIDLLAFSGCYSLTSVTIPEGVTSIGSYAFEGCSNLTSVTIPEGVTSIDYSAFRDCSSLTSVTIPEGVTSIGGSAFSGCSSLTSVTIPEDVTSIDSHTFYGCSSLADVYYGGSKTQWNALSVSLYTTRVHYSCTSAENHWTAQTIPATCGEEGSSFEECGCGYRRNETVLPATGEHNYSSAVTPPTCTECGATYTDNPTTPDDPTEPVYTNPFVDVLEGDYYYTPVLWAVNRGITNGLSADTFGPAETCTRGQIVTFLWRANGNPDPKSNANPFWDVAESDYFYKAVLWAVEEGITSGMGDGSFAPGAPCTRGQVATFLWRACGQPAPGGNNIFTDIASGAYYYDAVLWAVEKGITNGMGDGTFAPDAPCTRGQIVTFLYRTLA